jgi:hypothetical protein
MFSSSWLHSAQLIKRGFGANAKNPGINHERVNGAMFPAEQQLVIEQGPASPS